MTAEIIYGRFRAAQQSGEAVTAEELAAMIRDAENEIRRMNKALDVSASRLAWTAWSCGLLTGFLPALVVVALVLS